MGTGRALTSAAQGVDNWPRRFAWVPPTLVLVAAVLELLLPRRYGFAGLMSAAVVLGALTYRAAVAAAFAAVTFVLLVALHLYMDDLYFQQVTGALFGLLLSAAVAAVVATVRDRTERRLSRVRKVAEYAQLALLRPLPQQLGQVRMAGFYQAADDEALVGGDLYSCRYTQYGVRVLVGDVRGKGIGATETVATVISAFREAAMVCPTLPEITDRIEAALALDRVDAMSGASRGGELADAGGHELFTTAVLMEFPSGETAVRVLDRGHPPVIRVNGHGSAPLETDYGLPLGLGDLSPQDRTEPRYFPLSPGELLVAYSDGITEARDRDGAFYPLLSRLDEQYQARDTDGSPPIDPREIVDFIQQDVLRWSEKLSDDVVVLVLQPLPLDEPATRPPIR